MTAVWEDSDQQDDEETGVNVRPTIEDFVDHVFSEDYEEENEEEE